MYWVTLFIMFITGTTRINLFSMGYVISVFVFMWYGQEFLLKPLRTIRRRWGDKKGLFIAVLHSLILFHPIKLTNGFLVLVYNPHQLLTNCLGSSKFLPSWTRFAHHHHVAYCHKITSKWVIFVDDFTYHIHHLYRVTKSPMVPYFVFLWIKMKWGICVEDHTYTIFTGLKFIWTCSRIVFYAKDENKIWAWICLIKQGFKSCRRYEITGFINYIYLWPFNCIHVICRCLCKHLQSNKLIDNFCKFD